MLLEVIGGLLIGLAASLLWLSIGRIGGITGVIANIFLLYQGHRNWSVYFLIGLCASYLIYSAVYSAPVIEVTSNYALITIGGLLVGLGTYIGNGCTSGHGVCGIGRFSLRSIFATLVFIISGMITVFLLKLTHLI